MTARNRMIAIGDVHGEYGLLRKLIEEEIRFKPHHDRLVFLGDYIDRGLESRETVDYVQSLKEAHPDSVVLLIGNHEAMAREALERDDAKLDYLWYLNGGLATVKSYGDREAARQSLLPFITTLLPWYETDTHIFVHASADPDRPLAETPEDKLLWSRELRPHRSGKTLVVGHTIHNKVKFDEGVVVVDTGAFFYGVLSGYDAVRGTVYSASW